jgi:hypothetical protein
MYHQVDRKLLNPAQFGRPGGECPDASISKVIHNLICMLTRTPMGQFESDAKACFDREVMSFVLTCYQSNEAPLGPLRMWEQVLHNIVHQVKTGFGISKQSYSFSEDSPIHGPGQGSKGGPASCSTKTSILIDCMATLGHGLQFSDPSQQLSYTSTVQMFVDDASNGTNTFLTWLHEPPPLNEVATLTQQDSQTWERLLWTSGGLLNLSKCAFYIMAWKFDAKGHPSYNPKSDTPPLRLTCGNKAGAAAVNILDFDETHKYLGNHLATGMQMKDGMQALKSTADDYSSGLLCSSLSKQDTWVAYFTVFVPSMTYTLPVAHYSKKHLRNVQSPATRATLMKLGFTRNTAHRVVFGPSRYGGLGFRDLFIEQGISQLKLLIRHLRADSPQGRLLPIAIKWWHLVIDVSYPLLEITNTLIPHQSAHWLTALRQFLSKMEASLHIKGLHAKLPKPLRENDVCIMEVVLDMPSTSCAHLQAFERCRLFFGVIYLSEITTADGSAISRAAWEGTRARISQLLWPYQPQPGPKSFRAWRRLLATAFLKNHRPWVSRKTRDLTLRRPLQRWLPSSAAFRLHWESYCHYG